MNYMGWALLGMTGYSCVLLFVKLATREGHMPAFAVLAFGTALAACTAITIAIHRGDAQALTIRSMTTFAGYATIATGIALSIAVTSFVRALSLAPATVVVPIYGMFIVGGALLNIIFLGEALTLRKILGITPPWQLFS